MPKDCGGNYHSTTRREDEAAERILRHAMMYLKLGDGCKGTKHIEAACDYLSACHILVCVGMSLAEAVSA